MMNVNVTDWQRSFLKNKMCTEHDKRTCRLWLASKKTPPDSQAYEPGVGCRSFETFQGTQKPLKTDRQSTGTLLHIITINTPIQTVNRYNPGKDGTVRHVVSFSDLSYS